MEEFTKEEIKERILPELVPKLLEETKRGTIKWATTGNCVKNTDASVEYKDLKIVIWNSGHIFDVSSRKYNFSTRLHPFHPSLGWSFFFDGRVKPLKKLYSLLKKQRAEELRLEKIQVKTLNLLDLIVQAENKSDNQSPKKEKPPRKKIPKKKKKTPAPKKKHIPKEKQQTPKEKEPKIGRL